MTFDDAYVRLTQDIFPEQAIQTFTEARIMRALLDAASETAASFGFLIVTYRVPFVQAQTSRTIPSTTLGGVTFTPARIQRVERASFAGWNLKQGERVSGELDANHLSFLSGPPRFWYWKQELPDTITILPKAHKASELVFDAVQTLPTALPANVPRAQVEVWAGMHDPFQDIVYLTAAAKLFDSAYESDNPEAMSIKERLSRRRQEFALFMQNQSLATVPAGGGQ